jgi:putative capsular polysaccharide synthesis protein
MAKVGSTSVVEALHRARIDAQHVHRMHREHLRRMRASRRAHGWVVLWVPRHDRLGIRLGETLMRSAEPVSVVTLVREPIARNLSSYFEHLDWIWHMRNAHAKVSIDALCAGFISRFTHDDPLTWFDDEVLPVLGIDVYAHSFPSSGQTVIRKEPFELLILKSELEDATKSAALSGFFQRPIDVQCANSTDAKDKGVVFRQFVKALRLPAVYVERMLNARYTRHFYSDAERDAVRTRWA